MMTIAWPDTPYEPWRETCSALHLHTQVVGKYRLARTMRGFTTLLVPGSAGGVEIVLDLLDHAVIGSGTDGRAAAFALAPMSVADLHARFTGLLRSSAQRRNFTAARTRCLTRAPSSRTLRSVHTMPMPSPASSGRASPSIAC